MNVYIALKTIIERGGFNPAEIAEKLEVFRLAERLTVEQYAELAEKAGVDVGNKSLSSLSVNMKLAAIRNQLLESNTEAILHLEGIISDESYKETYEKRCELCEEFKSLLSESDCETAGSEQLRCVVSGQFVKACYEGLTVPAFVSKGAI
ncbi:MAG: hypothetical protein FWH20_00575 [Oscillospiraceae bacterium]|nr:hypothetical protein [Oscillospiraceae bacterium]